MKFQHHVLLLFFFLISMQAQADQLAWLSRAEAESAVAYFQTIDKPVILACYCCDDPEENWFAYDNARIKDTGVASRAGSGNYYEVVLSNAMATHSVDLAYVHVDVHGLRMCVGEILNMACDPCTEPASVQKFRITSAAEGETDISASLAEAGAHLELSNRGEIWYMNNIWLNRGSNSHGPVRNIETEEFPETDETYPMAVVQFDWDFANSYDDNTGTCHVVWTYIYKPNEVRIVTEITAENGESWSYQATDDGTLAY